MAAWLAEASPWVSSLKEADLIEQTAPYATNYCPSAPEGAEARIIQNTT